MTSALAAVLQECGRAWRRAALVPLRLLALLVGMLAVISALTWNLVTTRDLLQKQLASTQFLGKTGWRLDLRPDAIPARGLRLLLADSPALQAVENTYPSVWLISGLASIRSPYSAVAQHHGLAFANTATGLPSSNSLGETPCVWLGPRAPLAQEWIVEKRVRCRVLAPPTGWQSLASEIEQLTLVLPMEAASLTKGQGWRRSVATLLLAGVSPCLNAENEITFRCVSFAANRSAQADTAHAIGRWNAWVLPLSLVALLLVVLIYLQGLAPILKTEFALRMAVGANEVFAARWLLGAAFAQLAWVLLGLSLALAALSAAFQVGFSRTDLFLCAVWAVGCCVVGVPIIVVNAWRTRRLELQQLGRLD